MRRLLDNIPCRKQLSFDSALSIALPPSERSISYFYTLRRGDEINNCAQNISFQSEAIVQPRTTRPPGVTYCLHRSLKAYTYTGTIPDIV